jgi:urea transport system substrate-binding protein
MAEYEKTAVDATVLALDEINAQGGLLGKKIKYIITDGQSNATTFVNQAERLITQEKVSAIFGCWTSTDRKAVKPIVEKYNNLLFYPVQYEGLENSPNIAYTSTIPNQQAIPATTWCLDNLGKKVFLVASEELFTRATNEIIKDTIAIYGGQTVGEEYLKTNSHDVAPIIKKIVAIKPEVIINTIIGKANLTFFTQLREAGITSEKIPTMSLCIDEPELQKLGADYMTGDYSTWSHFQSIDRIENKEFVTKIKKRYGEQYVISDAMEAAYIGVNLWAQAVKKANSTSPVNVIPALKNQAFNAPEGIVHIDDKSLHTWSFVSIGKIRSDKQFTILWNSEKSIQPIIYPAFKTKEEWEALLLQWYRQWGNKWSNE